MATCGKKNSYIIISILLMFAISLQCFNPFLNLTGASYAGSYSTSGGEEVLVFLGKAVIGGLIYDGGKWIVKWGLSSLTPLGIAVALGTAGVMGVGALAIHMKNKSTLNYGVTSDGCRVINSNGDMICPTRHSKLKIS